MSLRKDINAGLKAISSPNATTALVLDKSGGCMVSVPIPLTVADLVDSNLMIKVQLSRTERLFSLLSPLATLNGTPSQAFLETLFNRQFYADQVSGATLAINAEQETLIAVYHWMLDSITPAEFVSLFQKFALAVLDLIEEVGLMSKRERQVKPIHKGRVK